MYYAVREWAGRELYIYAFSSYRDNVKKEMAYRNPVTMYRGKIVWGTAKKDYYTNKIIGESMIMSAEGLIEYIFEGRFLEQYKDVMETKR